MALTNALVVWGFLAILTAAGPAGIDRAKADPATKPAARKSTAKTTAHSTHKVKQPAARYPVAALRGWTLNRATSWAQSFRSSRSGFSPCPTTP